MRQLHVSHGDQLKEQDECLSVVRVTQSGNVLSDLNSASEQEEPC